MKKLFLLLSLCFCAIVVNAQDDERRNQWAMEAGIGGTGTTTFNLGVRWQYNFHPYVAWDVFTLNVQAPTEEISDNLVPQLMTGIRLKSPEFVGLKLYTVGRVGYGVNTSDGDYKGLALEIGAGINVTKHLYVGYAYNHQDLGTHEIWISKKKTVEQKSELKYHSFRIGWIF